MGVFFDKKQKIMREIVKIASKSMGNSASSDTSDLISSLGMLYRIPLHSELLLCNYYNPDNLSVQDQYSFSLTQRSKYIMLTACLPD